MAILLGMLVQACHAAGITNNGANKPWLVSAEAKSKLNAEELKQNYPMVAGFIKNGYTAYRITYNTTNTDGNNIIASGALFVPDIKGPLPLLNYDHMIGKISTCNQEVFANPY